MPERRPWTYLKERRFEVGLSLTALGLAIGRDTGVVSRYESGEVCPRPEVFPPLARALGCTTEDLLRTVPKWAEQAAS